MSIECTSGTCCHCALEEWRRIYASAKQPEATLKQNASVGFVQFSLALFVLGAFTDPTTYDGCFRLVFFCFLLVTSAWSCLAVAFVLFNQSLLVTDYSSFS